MIKVAFNATPLLSPITGIGNYIIELGAALAASDAIDPYSFYRYRWRHEPPRPPERGHAGSKSLATRIKPFIPFRGPLRQAAHHLGFAGGLKRHRIELYHEPNYVPLSYDVPVVITIHDLSWLRYPDTHPRDRVVWLERGLPKALTHARAILVDSEFVRSEVAETFGVEPSRLHTAPLGVGRDFFVRSAQETSKTLRTRGLAHKGYVLTVATIEPRKNLSHILETFAQLPASLRERFPLVIAGAQGWRSSGLVTRLRALADKGHLRYLGAVSQDELADLYAGAAAFAFPSLYEGFGLPPLEAMASGTPVIVSNRASLPEVVGEAGLLMEPDDPAGSMRTLQALLEDAAMREALSQRGIARAGEFTWTRCAAVAHRVYQDVLGHREPGRAMLRQVT